MTRLFTSGVESGSLEEFDSNAGAVIESSVVRTGDYSVRVNDDTKNVRAYITATDAVYLGGAFRTAGNPQLSEQSIIVFRLTDASLCEVRVSSDKKILVYRSSTLLDQSSPSALVVGSWQYFEVFLFIHDSTGRFVVKLDGVTIIDFTGDTKPTTVTDVYQVDFEGMENTNTYWDDMVINDDAGGINDDFPGVIFLEPLRPTAAGDQTGLSRGGTDSGANWSQVDEAPADGVEYVFDTVVDEYDLYNIENFTLPANATINNVIVKARAQLDSGSGSLAIMVKAGTTEAQSPDITLAPGPGWVLHDYVWDLNPDDSAAWEDADIDALQIGVKVR